MNTLNRISQSSEHKVGKVPEATSNLDTTLILASLSEDRQTVDWLTNKAGGKFIGYQKASTGTVGTFSLLKQYASTTNRPIVVIWRDQTDASTNSIVDDFNDGVDFDGGRYLLQWLNALAANVGTYSEQAKVGGYKARFGWFQGSQISPTDVKLARDFCLENGGSSSSGMLALVYWQYEDGITYAKCTEVKDVASFKTWVYSVLLKNEADKHKDGSSRDYGYKVMNPTIQGILDWEAFKNSLVFPATGGISNATVPELPLESYLDGSLPTFSPAITSLESSDPTLEASKVFKPYFNNGVTSIDGSGLPRYGVGYLQEVKSGSSLDVANWVISSAKANKVPLIIIFSGKLTDTYMNGFPYWRNLPSFFLIFEWSSNGQNHELDSVVDQLMTREFGVEIFNDRTHYSIKENHIVWYDGTVIKYSDLRNSTPILIPDDGFCETTVATTYQKMLHLAAPEYKRQKKFEQINAIKEYTKYEQFAASKLFPVNLAKTMDSVYTPTIHICPDSTTASDFKYGIWYGSSGLVGGGASKDSLAEFKECHIKELHAFCDANNIPLIVYSTNVLGGCGICNSVHLSFEDRAHYRNWLRKAPYMFFADISWHVNGAAQTYIRKSLGIDLGESTSMGIYWKKPDGTTFRAGISSPLGNYFSLAGSRAWVHKSYSAEAISWLLFYDQLHEAIDFMLRDYKRDQRFENKYCYPYLVGWDPGDDAKKSSKFTVSFDLNGGFGYLNPLVIETSEKSALVNLPSKTEVASAVSKTGFELESFKDLASGVLYEFSQTISISANFTLSIVWKETQGEDDRRKDDKGQESSPNSNEDVRGTTNSYIKSQFPVYHQYDSFGEKAARVSGNLSSLGVVGHLMTKNAASRQLVRVNLNPKISDIAPSCFAECRNLAYIDAGNKVKSVGNHAFYNCSNLSGVSFLASENKELTRIGDYAFAGSGLKSIKLNLQGSVADSSINTHCFANCKQLSSVEMINSTYLGDHMFDGCDNLVDVKLNNYHSYVNPFAFANCRTIAKIQIPANIYMLSPHMFEGCVNLTSIQFQSGSQLRQLGECVFSGCTKLTSISLPASINDLNYIDPLFLSGSSIQRVEFAGLSDDVFINEVYKKISVDYETHKWYSSPKATVEGLMNTCHENHLPMIVNLGNSASQCSRCKTWEQRVTDQASWKTWFNNSQYFYVHAMYGVDAAAYYAASGFISKNTKLEVPGTFPRIYVYWNKLNDDGTETLVAYGGDGVNDSDFNVAARLIAKADSTFAGYDGLSSYSYEIKSQITTFGLGAGKKVIYVSSTGKEYECSNDAVEYTPEVKVDKTTTTNFKFGTWYRNAKQLVAAANAAGVPVLAEFGSIGCDPCIDFRKNTFNNQNFQREVTSLPVLLCKVEIGEGESFDYPATSQAHWISHSFGDPKTYIPQLIFYWNPPASVSTASPYKEIWNYNYRSDAANANYQTVLNKLDTMLNHFPGGKEWLATISSSFEGKTIYSGDIGRYLYYKNEVGDTDGRYFVCDSKTRIQTWDSAVLSIKNEDELTPIRPLEELEQLCSAVDPILQDFQLFSSSGFSQPELATYTTSGAYSIFNSISENDIVEIAKATYQCFTTTPDMPASNLSGVIFKVSEMSAVNSRAVVLDGGTWKYANDMSTVDAGDLSRIALKNGVEYLYKFLNEEDDIPDSPKDDDWPLGSWIEATETTSREAFEDIYKDSESDSVVLVIAEDLETSTASATLEDGTSASVQVNLSGVRVDDVEKAAKETFKKEGKTATSINNLDELRVAASFKMMISEDTTFKNWMKRSGYRFLLVRTNDWSKGFPQALRYFEEEVSFEGNKTTDKLPKILVYHGCSTCVISGVALYCRKKIAVDQVRTDSTYYSGLIDAYAELADDYIWHR